MKEKLKNSLIHAKNSINAKTTKVALVATTAALPLVTFAEETGGASISSTVVSSLSTVATDTINTIAAIAPVGLTIFAAKFAWEFGVKFFTKMAKR